VTTPRSAQPTGVWRLADRHTARGLGTGDDDGNGIDVGAGVGAAVGDGTDTAVGDETGTVLGDGSSTVVGGGIRRVGGFPTDLRRVDSARATTTGTALPSMPEAVRPLAR
jgi:hypothetical protein